MKSISYPTHSESKFTCARGMPEGAFVTSVHVGNCLLIYLNVILLLLEDSMLICCTLTGLVCAVSTVHNIVF